MAQSALGLLADPALAARLAEAGYRRVQEQFTTRHVCEQLAGEYRSILAAETAQAAAEDD